MKLLEYQGKNLFAKYGLPVPRGKVAEDPQEAEEAAAQLGERVVLKAQVPVGGRGKAGGIKYISHPQQLFAEAEALFRMDIGGFPVEKILVEEWLEAVKEIYMGLLVDADTGDIVFLFSPEGGVNIEAVAASRPEKVFRLAVDPLAPPPLYRLRAFLRQGGFQGKILEELTKIAARLLQLFFAKELLIGEINPLAILPDQRVLALDAKVEVDDNALFRQEFEKKFWEEQDLLEKEARHIGVTYVKLNGSVGVIGSGAGLAMATMDMLEERGYAPANFLETGGGITEDLMYNALKLVCKNSQVAGVVINLYGGVNPIEKGAKGIVRFVRETQSPPPIVVKALGNKQEECWETLREGGVTVVTSVKTEDAVDSIIKLINSRKEKGANLGGEEVNRDEHTA